jgi:hypothetical protein
VKQKRKQIPEMTCDMREEKEVEEASLHDFDADNSWKHAHLKTSGVRIPTLSWFFVSSDSNSCCS